jgi:hypothetical protein
VDFALFLVVTAILFVRPSDFVPGLESVPLFLIAIVPCLLLSWHKLMPQLNPNALRERPVLLLGFGIVLAAVLSCVVYRQFEQLFKFVNGFSKTLLFYALMLAHLDSPRRLKLFAVGLVVMILIPTLIFVSNYHGLLHFESLKVMDDADAGVRRLNAEGTFGDPNDLCEVLNCGLIYSLSGLLDPLGGCLRVMWLGPLGFLGYALFLTRSRGGFLAAVVGLMVLLRSRFRGARFLVLSGVGLALMLVVFAGRQTSLSATEGTSQARIQLWSAGFSLFLRNPISPLIGVGNGAFLENVGHVAHNTFVQMYTELGFLGGTFLFGQYFWCLTNMVALGSQRLFLPDPQMRRLQPFVLASLASFTMSEMSLTNCTGMVTYVILGIPSVFIRLADPKPPLRDAVLNGRLFARIVWFSGLWLVALYLFTKLMVRLPGAR